MKRTPTDQIKVTIVYARPDACLEIKLCAPHGTTVGEALSRSDIMLKHPEITAANRIGVYGTAVGHDYILEDRDRIEIYRSLVADPKDARRKRLKSPVTGGLGNAG